MLDVIGATLTNAVAVAISPVPLIAVILMLMSPRAKQLGYAFLAGWFLGILIAATAFTLLADVIPEPERTGTQPVIGIIQLLLGAGLVFLAWRQWKSRPAPGTSPALPAWMSRIDTMRVPTAFGLAFALAAINPKNLLVAASAGAVIGRAQLDPTSSAISVLIFAAVAAVTVLLPVLFATIAPATAAKALVGVRTWLTANNAVIMTVLLTTLGVNVIGKGLGSF